MMKILLTILLLFPLLVNAQAHLGESLSGLRARYPDIVFELESTNDGSRYTMAEQPLGTFVYYFDSETGLTEMCVQIPDNLQALNTQVEIYNKKYVILTESSWKAYLDGGVTMNISLIYNEEYETYIFYYTF
jgi:hypothetical protein